MDDLISRQAAIDTLDELCNRICEYSKKQRHTMCGACNFGSAFDVIDELPSAQSSVVTMKLKVDPEDVKKAMQNAELTVLPSVQRRGKWISLDDFRGRYNEYGYKCSECGERCDFEENYCPNCGAKMEL